ncbi:MAG: hypothetical protein Q4P66_07365, partial [Actinomycetaceae bacterium]|nr:hypothetical protein [Actinomycetaceae bacterium]
TVMFGLLAETIFYALFSLLLLTAVHVEMPNIREKKSGRKRSLNQRWQLMKKRLRIELFLGICSAIVAILGLLQILKILPINQKIAIKT